ncbi:hypothetical protein Pan181_00340 [Aeoliella mucimassa]|uniref:Uncharacterized protein n=1 Tax=Aeoliella mucimassa TaxID=2527972 RepID=A0A518AGK9_9BACT|nr:hypothetical protein Pan181_00340 [Aeoliella mucimassa]
MKAEEQSCQTLTVREPRSLFVFLSVYLLDLYVLVLGFLMFSAVLRFVFGINVLAVFGPRLLPIGMFFLVFLSIYALVHFAVFALLRKKIVIEEGRVTVTCMGCKRTTSLEQCNWYATTAHELSRADRRLLKLRKSTSIGILQLPGSAFCIHRKTYVVLTINQLNCLETIARSSAWL